MTRGHDNILEMAPDIPADELHAVGDGKEFDAFVRAQRRHLLNYFHAHLPTNADAQDAAQESLLRLLRYRHHKPAADWRPLLFRIAGNVVGEFFRRGAVRGIHRQVPLAECELVSQAPSQEDLVEQEQREALLRAAIVALPARCRQVYMLSRVDGLTYSQIARHCDISVKTVEKHIIHALALLQQRVGGGGGSAL